MRQHTRERSGECGHHGDRGRHRDRSDDSLGFMGRHRGGRGFGRLMAGLAGGAGMGARGFGAGRKLAAGDLQLIILALLAEEGRHGYEIIKALEERSSGFYSPSPGMVYPALTYLEELGYATVEAAGAKKLYRITEAGSAYLEENKAIAQAMLEQLGWIGRRMEHMRRAFTGEETGSAGEEAEDSGPGTHAELHEARHALKAALREHRKGGPDEERRVAEILKRAADEIRGK